MVSIAPSFLNQGTRLADTYSSLAFPKSHGASLEPDDSVCGTVVRESVWVQHTEACRTAVYHRSEIKGGLLVILV